MFFINHSEITEGKAAIIEIKGPLNSETSPDFEDYINRLLESGILHIIIDIKDLSYISSEGIGVMLMIQKLISKKRGMLVLLSLSREIETLFSILGFLEIFKITDNRADALKVLDRAMELDISPEPGVEVSHKPDIATTDSHEKSEETTRPVKETKGPERVSSVFIDETPERISLQKKEKAFEPFIIKCVSCSNLIRINEIGPHICPECSAEFEVTDPGRAVFS
ncbi:MAG: STAS domain-containing protein [Spirochaetota bacterium]